MHVDEKAFSVAAWKKVHCIDEKAHVMASRLNACTARTKIYGLLCVIVAMRAEVMSLA